jgi:endogenous inhibitor of DNA gyrase (YacG/DUF329 family)
MLLCHMNEGTKRHIHCPTCGKEIIWSEENPWRPFCSERCRLIDLGAWATETHRIPGEKEIKSDSDAEEQEN